MPPPARLIGRAFSRRTSSLRIHRPPIVNICPSCLRNLSTSISQSTTPPRAIPLKWTSRAYSTPPPHSTPPSQPHMQYPQPGDDPEFSSVLDRPARLVRSGRRHGPGLIILALIPLTAFALGTWQIFRLEEKVKLINTYEDRLLRPPLPLPPIVDLAEIPNFDYRRVQATGVFRHDQEMLLGPRLNDGVNGFMVITPLERRGEGGGETGSTILVNRGWIAKTLQSQTKRRKLSPNALPEGEVTVEGLLRPPFKKNMFTPDNAPEKGEFYFPDMEGMAKLVGAQPVWVEETLEPTILEYMDRERKGVPIGRMAEVTLRNQHVQYIVTWYALGIATSIMFYIVVRKPPRDIAQRVRLHKEWS